MESSSLVFIGLGVVIGIEGFLLHLLSLKLVVLVHSFPHILKASIFSFVLNNYCLALSLHLLSEQSILFGL